MKFNKVIAKFGRNKKSELKKKKNGNIELFNILKYIFLYRNSIPPIYYYFLNLEEIVL
jgi:hypothetical protein